MIDLGEPKVLVGQRLQASERLVRRDFAGPNALEDLFQVAEVHDRLPGGAIIAVAGARHVTGRPRRAFDDIGGGEYGTRMKRRPVVIGGILVVAATVAALTLGVDRRPSPSSDYETVKVERGKIVARVT